MGHITHFTPDALRQTPDEMIQAHSHSQPSTSLPRTDHSHVR
jgi:hypothetical protein